MIKRYHERRKIALELLGSKCAKCGSVEKLEIDHIDRSQKKYSTERAFSLSYDKFLAEIKKCQLLCKKCHTDKSIVDAGYNKGKGNHGTKSSYRYCRCDDCKKANTEYCKKWVKEHNYNNRRRELRKISSIKQ